jgi:hypothetical protein
MASPDTTDVARPLRVLVPLIMDELAAGDAAGLEHYRRAGELLLEARAQLEAGQWRAWLQRHCSLSSATAWRYMTLATMHAADARRRQYRTLTEATERARPSHQPVWHGPVQRMAARVDVERLAQEAQSRDKERQLMHALAHRLIDIGYKVLATQLHPDKGGSAEAMERLNRVRARLKAAAL